MVSQIEERSIDSEGADARGNQKDPDGFTLQSAEVKERNFVFDLVLVFNFSLLVLYMKNGTSLGMVERCRAVEGTQDESDGDCPCDDLKA